MINVTYRHACSHNFIEERYNQTYLEIGVLKKLFTKLLSGKKGPQLSPGTKRDSKITHSTLGNLEDT